MVFDWGDCNRDFTPIDQRSKGTNVDQLVSTINVGPICRSFFLVVLTMPLSISSTGQTVVSNIHAADSKDSCTTDQPLFTASNGKPIWLDTDSLLKSARHCAPPEIASIGRMARTEGYVSVDILVNGTGKVWCVRLVSGHPILASSAINAAKDWTFQPKKKDGKPLWFYGHLRFHYSSGESTKDENPCTVAHW